MAVKSQSPAIVGRVSLMVTRPKGVWQRMRGLMWTDEPPPGEALLLERCRSIHTFGMRYPIRVAWLDKQMRVIGVQVVKRRRLAWNIRAKHTLEMSLGTNVELGEEIV
jgi:uncharacterized protein